MSTTAERLWQTVKALPEPMLTEVLDFAEFLRFRPIRQVSKSDNISLMSLCGGLEHTKTFAGSPLAIQQQLRDEWR